MKTKDLVKNTRGGDGEAHILTKCCLQFRKSPVYELHADHRGVCLKLVLTEQPQSHRAATLLRGTWPVSFCLPVAGHRIRTNSNSNFSSPAILKQSLNTRKVSKLESSGLSNG